MSHRPFRFLHASDLHLDILPSGMAEIPVHLRRVMLDSASAALARLVETAIAENVDFVVLAGDVIQADQAGPRSLSHLCAQLECLAAANISVYWASGQVDPPAQWPSAIALPANVHRFSAGPVTRIKHTRDARPLVELVGTSQQRSKNIQPKDYLRDDATLPTVVVAHGSVDARKAEKQLAAQGSPSYWALGGQHTRDTILSGAHVAHYAGTPQGRSPTENGPHGITLVEFDQDGVFHTSLVETDTLRWCDECLEIDNLTTADQLEQMLRKRLDSLADVHGARTRVIAVAVIGEGTLLGELRAGSLAADLVELLQADYGHRDAPLWVSGISASTSSRPKSQHASQDTILGDYLLTIAAIERGEHPLDFNSLLPSKKQLEMLSVDFELQEPGEISAVLSAAHSRGIDLLGGEAKTERAVAAGGPKS